MGQNPNSSCRACQSSLAATPLVSFDGVAVAPLSLRRCTACGLVQLGESTVVPAVRRFETSAVAPELIKALDRSLPPNPRLAVVDLAGAVSHPGQQAPHAVLLCHALEHSGDAASLFAQVNAASGLQTRLFIQVRDLRRVASNRRYGAVRHGTPCYFDVASLDQTLFRFGWTMLGGVSLTDDLVVWAAREEHRDAHWTFPIAGNLAVAIPDRDLNEFASSWRAACAETRATIENLRSAGARIAAYGPAADIVATLGPAGLDGSWLDAIYDPSTVQPGQTILDSRVSVTAPGRAFMHQPDVLLVADPAEEAALDRGTSRLKRAARRILSLSTLPMRPIGVASHPHHPEAAA